MSEDQTLDTQKLHAHEQSDTLELQAKSNYFTINEQSPDHNLSSSHPEDPKSATYSKTSVSRSLNEGNSRSSSLPTPPPDQSIAGKKRRAPRSSLSKVPYRLFLMILIMAQGAISYLLLNGWKWSPIGEPLAPSSTIGLEQVRASLFEQGLMLTEGYTNLILGPLISQMLWLGSLFERLSAPYVDYPWLTSRVILSVISLIGMMWGCSLLFKR